MGIMNEINIDLQEVGAKVLTEAYGTPEEGTFWRDLIDGMHNQCDENTQKYLETLSPLAKANLAVAIVTEWVGK